MKTVLLLCLVITATLAFYPGRQKRAPVNGLIDKIQRALQRNTPLEFNGNDSLCMNYSVEEECTSVGFLDTTNFNKLREAFPGLIEIPFCRVYNNFYGCDFCEAGRAFNGNECAPCTLRPSLRGSEVKHECEYPWKAMINNSLYNGSGNQRRSGLGYILSACFRVRNSSSWDACLRAKSHLRQQIPRQMTPGTNPRRGLNYHKARGFWLDIPFNKRMCNAYSSMRIPWCNCKSTNDRNTCNECEDDFLLKGVVSGMNSSRYDSIMDNDTSLYSGYMCVLKRQRSQGCKVLRHNMDQGEEHSCLVCDYNNGYKMGKDGYCMMSQ